MGVVYKLSNDIKAYIVQQKELNPRYGCRSIATLVNGTFNIKLSKSHINSVIRQEGLSNRVGRPTLAKKGLFQGVGIGSYLLRAADALLGGSIRITELLRTILPEGIDSRAFIEAGIYSPLFPGYERASSDLWRLVSAEGDVRNAILSHLADIYRVMIKYDDARDIFDGITQEIRGIKLSFANNVTGIVDGQMRTLWQSIDMIPHDFSAPLLAFNRLVDNPAIARVPMVLFSNPGYDTAPTPWIDMLRTLSEGVPLGEMAILDGKGNTLRTITDSHLLDHGIVAALWPWQYLSSCTVNEQNEQYEWYFREIKRRFFLTEAAVSLKQKNTNIMLKLRCLVVRTARNTKPITTLICTKSRDDLDTISVASAYIKKCPNWTDGSKDFNRKIELFTYNQSSRRPFSGEHLIYPPKTMTVKDLFECYLSILDNYVRWYFLPSQYKEADFATTAARFYGLKGKVRDYPNYSTCTFLPDHRTPYRSDLFYSAQRMNDREIARPGGGRIWFFVK